MTDTAIARGDTPIATDITDENADRYDAALRAGWAIISAYQHGLLPPNPGYLADTLYMVLTAVPDRAPRRQLMP